MSICSVGSTLAGTTLALTPTNGNKDDTKFEFLNDIRYPLDSAPEDVMRQDDLNYWQAWFTHYSQKEHKYKPFYPTVGQLHSELEIVRIHVIRDYWTAARRYRINPVTIHLGVWILNRLVHSHWTRRKLTDELFAGTAAVALRIALKFEERPEALWAVRHVWDALPMFNSWSSVERTDAFLLKVEAGALRTLEDCFDVPLAVQFFDRFVLVGGWPADLVKEYTSLGHFMLALSTFATGENNPLSHTTPSKLAAAALVLSVKIVNGDTKRFYEWFPERLQKFTQCQFKDLQPIMRGLSSLLRSKPAEADILAEIYPEWGQHAWQ